MEIFNNTTKVVRDDLEQTIRSGSRISVAAACFSIYAYEALKSRLDSCEELRFIFTSPAFVAEMIDSLTELSGVYNTLAKKLDKAENLDEILNTFRYTDKMVEKAISFIIENSVLPRIESLQRVMN